PVKWRASEGRVNSRGIPCLYTATDLVTAVAETRAWIGSYVSVAEMKTSRELRLLNCVTEDRPSTFLFGEPDPAKWEKYVWGDIDRAFARPAERDDLTAEYAATQILAEHVRRSGFDGIAYRSSLASGYNVALFDVDAADVVNCAVFEVKALTYQVDQVSNHYFVSKFYPQLGKGVPT